MNFTHISDEYAKKIISKNIRMSLPSRLSAIGQAARAASAMYRLQSNRKNSCRRGRRRSRVCERT